MRLTLIALGLLAASRALAAEPVAVPVPGFACAGSPLSISLPARWPDLRRLAPLQAEEVLGVEPWDGYQAITRALRFAGLRLEVVTFTNDPERYLLSLATITRPSWALGPLRVGADAATALRPWGITGPPPGAGWRIEGESDAVVVEATPAGRIARVTYDCYTG